MHSYNKIKSKIMKRIILVIFVCFVVNLNAQTDGELLDKKIGEAGIEAFQGLKDRGIISEINFLTLPHYILELTNQGVDINNLTYGQILDSLNVLSEKMDAEVSKFINFGNDSIFIRTPIGEKFFIGLGEMSLEKLVERESNNLPKKYKKEVLNKKFDNELDFSATMNEIGMDDITFTIFGTALLILPEQNKDLSKFKVGDVLEITNRIKKSKEFKPIIELLEKNF